MALVTPSEVIEYGKLQLPASQTAAQAAARNSQLTMLIEAATDSLAEQLGYRFDEPLALRDGSAEVTVENWDTRPNSIVLPKRMQSLVSVVSPSGLVDAGAERWTLVGSGWRVQPLPRRVLEPGVWRFTGKVGWAKLPSAARTLLLTWVVDTYDTSGSVTQEVNEDGLTTIGFATSLPIWHQNYYLQSLMK